MKVTKYLHSCLLIEENDTVILIDPGEYTYNAKILDLNYLEKIDTLLFTHEHTDHFFLPFVTEISQHFPKVHTIAPQSVAAQLQKERIPVSTKGTYDIRIQMIPHEEILFAPPPENIMYTLFDRLTHPGDSYHITNSTDILAMPMTAPWGSLVQAMKKVIELQPKVVIPIHDWHWKDEAIDMFYPRVTELFKQHGIEFLYIKTGEPTTI